MSFPVEAVPDGDPFGPHHIYVGLLVVLIAAAIVWDDYRRQEPVLTMGGTFIALFAFATVWQYYHATGAALSFIALLLVGLGMAETWIAPEHYSAVYYGAVAIGLSIALDDWVSHALGIWTPLDHVWTSVILPIIT